MPAAASSASSAATSSARPSPRAPSTRMKGGGGHGGGGGTPNNLPGPGGYQSAPLSSRKAQALDMSTVERRSSSSKENPKRIRPHGLQEAPTYRPTPEQFKDPFEYIKSIAEEGKKYGIIKIIPPDTWNPEFAVDTEVCWVSRSLVRVVGVFTISHPPFATALGVGRFFTHLFLSFSYNYLLFQFVG